MNGGAKLIGRTSQPNEAQNQNPCDFLPLFHHPPFHWDLDIRHVLEDPVDDPLQVVLSQVGGDCLRAAGNKSMKNTKKTTGHAVQPAVTSVVHGQHTLQGERAAS